MMPDRKKVIRAVETCFDSWIDKHLDMGLDFHKVEQLKREALELLKEQEPVKPFPYHDIYWCGKCGNKVLERHTVHDTQLFLVYKYKFCPECGKKVDWNA
jgi:DNA-directed RNA polymerase subunit RPC12/RpoP